MSGTNKGISLVVTALSVIVFLIIGFFAYQEFFSHKGAEDNINFSRTGNLVMNNPGMESDAWYLVYEKPGSPAINVKLSFDGKSACKTDDGSCLGLIVGDEASVKGIETSGGVLVRELEVVGGNEMPSGPSIVDWDTAMGFISDCAVKRASANSNREVYLTLDDGRTIFSVEPKDGLISDEIKAAEKDCGSIPLETE